MNRNGHQQSATITTIDNPQQNAGCDFSVLLKQLRTEIQKRDLRKREDWHDRSEQIHSVDFVEWHVVANLLDRFVPEWSYAVRGIVPIGDFIVVTAAQLSTSRVQDRCLGIIMPMVLGR